MPRWLVAIAKQDLLQEAELARLEGKDPKQAVRAFIRAEHRFYDLVGYWYLDVCDTKLADAPLPLPKPERTEQGKAARAERNRAWWRANGAAYRASRKAEGRPLKGGSKYRRRTDPDDRQPDCHKGAYAAGRPTVGQPGPGVNPEISPDLALE